jgi:hypothetical protein
VRSEYHGAGFVRESGAQIGSVVPHTGIVANVRRVPAEYGCYGGFRQAPVDPGRLEGTHTRRNDSQPTEVAPIRPQHAGLPTQKPLPALRAHVRFKDSVPADVSALVASSGLDVSISEVGELSMEEQQERARVVFDALVLAGYRNVVTFHDPQTSLIRMEIQQDAGAARPSAEDVALAVQTFHDPGLPGKDEPFEAAGLHVGLTSGRAVRTGRSVPSNRS